MTLADIIILIITISIVCLVIWNMLKNKNAGCETCSYLKHCKTGFQTAGQVKKHPEDNS